MKKYSIIFLTVLISALFAQRRDLTLEDVFKNPPFEFVTSGQWNWIPNSDSYSFLQSDTSQNVTSLYKYDLATGDTALYISSDNFNYKGKQLSLNNYLFDDQQEKILLITELRKIWRHSFSAIYYLYDLESQKILILADGNRLRNVKFSPNGRYVSYIKTDNNLYVFNSEKKKEIKLTKDGSFNILNGHYGWVYEEEFGSYDAYRWSPDSKLIAFVREDQTFVKQFPMVDELKIYPDIKMHHYPKVGEKNPLINIGIVNVNTRRTKWLDLKTDEEMYYPRFTWLQSFQTKSGKQELVVRRINRHQNRIEFVRYNVKKGKGKIFWTDHSPAWIELTDDLFFLRDGSFITLSERSGFRHIYHFEKDGAALGIITVGNWEVSEITAFDEKNDTIYFIGKKDSPLQANLYSVKLDGSDFRLLDNRMGWHQATFSPTNKYYIDTYSNANSPVEITLHRANGKKVRDLSITDPTQFDDYKFPEIEFIQIPTSNDSTLLNAMIALPRDFNPQEKYPAIVYGYSGPGSQTVVDRQGRWWLLNKYLNQKGYITFSIDPRGTGGRGTHFKHLAYKDIGKWVVHDQVEGAKYLSSLPYVDGSRIGIWGWSGGGYMTALCMTKGAPNFKVGVAIAPVTDLRLYDTIWTESYMGLLSENKKGYDNASVLNYADQLQGKLLLIHGTGDDNVHPQNTIQLMDEFVRADKHVDILLYANRNHGIFGGNTTFHMWTKIINYFKENL